MPVMLRQDEAEFGNGSPAIGKGTAGAGVPLTDQRGFPRFVDGDTASAGAQLDIGAVEAGPLVRVATTGDAGGFTLRLNRTTLVPWASSLKAYRQMCPNMLLYWSMMEQAINQGAEVFDFGRSLPDSGTMLFKTQWGGIPEPQVWEYLLISAAAIPNQGSTNTRFNMAIEVWKRLPLAIANATGPFIVRNIP